MRYRTIKILMSVAVSASAIIAIQTYSGATSKEDSVDISEQGWNDIERDLYYYTSQGTFLMPAAWLDSLEMPDGQRFMERANMESYGFLFDDRSSPANPYSWPIGIAIDKHPRNNGIEQAGLTCAACHTGQIEFSGRKLRIDGSQANIDFRQFALDLNKAIVATGATAGSRARFKERAIMRGYPGERLNADFDAAYANALKQTENPPAYMHGMTPAGRGRLDAVTSIANSVFAQALAVPENTRPSVAPTSFPPLWDIWRFDWVQYNASARQPMGRNIIEALGTGPITIADPYTGELLPEPERWRTNIRVRNIHAIETTLHKLTPPKWPENILGKVDKEFAQEGSILFKENCASCHGVKIIKNTSDPAEWHVPLIPLTKIGTDAQQAVNFARNRYDASKIGGPVDMGIPEGLIAVLAQVKKQAYIDEDVTAGEIPVLDGFGRPDDEGPAPCGYKARPLVGIWATGPFLHNGSVPTIYDLLSESRPSHFLIGSPKFDPVKLGQAQEQDAGVTTVDTSLPGNGNYGHWFTNEIKRPGRIGRALSERERFALIEYLKIANYENYPRQEIDPPSPAACSDNRYWADVWSE